MHPNSGGRSGYSPNGVQKPPIDLIGDALRIDIERYRLLSFDTFDLHVVVSPISNTNRIINAQGQQVGFEEYRFDVFGDDPKRMKVCLNGQGHVRVHYLNRWGHISSFLKHLKPPIDWNDPGDFPRQDIVLRRWEQQARWWLANGKKFRLLDLPAEVREICYGHVFGPFIEPYPASRARRLGPSSLTMMRRMPNFNILLACKLVYQEASAILFDYTPFLIEHYGVLGTVTMATPLRSRIRRLELALTHDAFLYLFRHETARRDGEIVPDRSHGALALRRMRLTRLELTFAPPSFTTGSGIFDGACQKAVVKGIVDLAWPFIHGHPVQLSGFIKTSQKAAIDATCNLERHRFELWRNQRAAAELGEGWLSDWDDEDDDEDGGVMLDGTMPETVAARTEGMSVSSLRCRCKVRCSLRHWTPED